MRELVTHSWLDKSITNTISPRSRANLKRLVAASTLYELNGHNRVVLRAGDGVVPSAEIDKKAKAPRKKAAPKSKRAAGKEVEAGPSEEVNSTVAVSGQEKLHDTTHEPSSSGQQSQSAANVVASNTVNGTTELVAPGASASPDLIAESEPVLETNVAPTPVVRDESKGKTSGATTKKRGRPASGKKKAAVMAVEEKEDTMQEYSDAEDDEAEKEDGSNKKKTKRGPVDKVATDTTVRPKKAPGPKKKRETKKQKGVKEKKEAERVKANTDTASIEASDDHETDKLIVETVVRKLYQPPGFRVAAGVEDENTVMSVACTEKTVGQLDDGDDSGQSKREPVNTS